MSIATHWGPAATREGGLLGRAHGVAEFQRTDLLDRRVRRLLGEDAPVRTHVTRGSLTGAATALSVMWMSGLMMSHPLTHAATAHCAHHRVALSHLFCLGRESHPAGAPCPHAGL